MVKLLPLLQVILRNNGVTFDLIFSLTGIVKYSCYSTGPENLLPVFCGFGGIISEYVSLHFPALVIDAERKCTEQSGVLGLKMALAFITRNGL